MKLPLIFINVHASVYERAFELILRNVYIFKLPLVDDRNTIWFMWLFLRMYQSEPHYFKSTTPLEIINVDCERNLKFLSVI